MSSDSLHTRTRDRVDDRARDGRAAGAHAPLPRDRTTLVLVMAAAALVFFPIAALVSGQWYVLMRGDLALARLFYDAVHPEPTLGHGIEVWTEVFGTWSMRVVSVLVAGWLLLRRQFSTAAWAIATVFLANLAGLVVKLGVDRDRPQFTDPISTGVGPSFPSGHALMATVGMGLLLFAALPLLRGRWRVTVWVLAVAIALSTALSRPLLGVHWVSDVVSGVALGVLVLAATMLLWTYLPSAVRRWDREPA